MNTNNTIVKFVAEPYVIINVINNRKYAQISSLEYPELIVHQKSVKISMIHDDVDITNDFVSAQYYILIDCNQIYNSKLDLNNMSNNILPVYDVPFGLLKYHELQFVFLIPDNISNNSVDTLSNSLRFVFEIQISTPDESHEDIASYNGIYWFVNDEKINNKLIFRSGTACVRYTYKNGNDEIVPKYETIKLYDTYGCIRYTDLKIYGQNNTNEMLFISVLPAILILIDIKDVHGPIIVVYEKQYYEFTANNNIYVDDCFSFFTSGCDGISNFVLAYYYNTSENNIMNYIDDEPTIIFNNITLRCKKYIHNSTLKKIMFYFDVVNSTTQCIWFNVTNKKFLHNKKLLSSLKITGLIPSQNLSGKYVLEFERIFCSKEIRQLMMNNFTKKCVEFNMSNTLNDTSHLTTDFTKYIKECDLYNENVSIITNTTDTNKNKFYVNSTDCAEQGELLYINDSDSDHNDSNDSFNSIVN